MVKKPRLIYELKVVLDGIRPPIWRVFRIPAEASLLKERGLILYQLERYRESLEDLQAWVRGSEDDEDEDEGDDSPATQHAALLLRVLSAMN